VVEGLNTVAAEACGDGAILVDGGSSSAVGTICSMPAGTFYVWADMSFLLGRQKKVTTDAELARFLLGRYVRGLSTYNWFRSYVLAVVHSSVVFCISFVFVDDDDVLNEELINCRMVCHRSAMFVVAATIHV
jgi:hypothetical protein